jgi:uncharacterized membrane protein
MNWRRGLFRLWIVGTVLFVLAVAFVSYSTAEDRLSFRRYLHTSFAAASGRQTIAIYEVHDQEAYQWQTMNVMTSRS